VAVIPSARAIRAATTWACSRKVLDALASIRTGAPTSSIIMYVRSPSEAASRSWSAAPCAVALPIAADARCASVRMMAACAPTARARSLS
jgi:hypothetical protein